MTKVISLYAVKDVYNFVRNAERVEGDVIISRGIYSINGKSILGVMSLDVTEPFKVEYPDDATSFNDYLLTFEAK